MTNTLALFGRIAIALIFVMAGFHKIATFSDTLNTMTGKGLPYANILLVLSIIFELGGGLLVLVGWKARFGALSLFLFMIPVTLMFHAFWMHQTGDAINQLHHFLKNLSMMGGTLYVMAYGPGRFSIDGRGK